MSSVVVHIYFEPALAAMLCELVSELGSVVTPASSTLLDEARRKRFHSKVAQLLYLGKRIRMDILTALAFLTTRLTKAIKEADGKLLRALKCLRGTPDIGLVFDASVGW